MTPFRDAYAERWWILITTTIFVTLFGTAGMFSASPMLVCASWHDRSKKIQHWEGKSTTFCRCSWFLHWVSQRNVTRIVSTEVSVTILHLVWNGWKTNTDKAGKRSTLPSKLFYFTLIAVFAIESDCTTTSVTTNAVFTTRTILTWIVCDALIDI